MCQPFNEHQPIRDEFHGLLLFVIAVSSLYFMLHMYKPQTQQTKKAARTVAADTNVSSSKLEYQKSHKFREEQRAKYRKHKTLKKNTQDDKGSQGSLVGRNLTFKSFNITPLSTPKLGKRQSIFNTQSSSMSSMRAGESSLMNSNERFSPISKESSSSTSNMFSYHNQSTPSSLNTKILRFQQAKSDSRAVSFDISDVSHKDISQISSEYLSRHRYSYDARPNTSETRFNKLARHNPLDASNHNDFGPIKGMQKQILRSNESSNKSKNEIDRKTSLRRKALSVEMIKHSSEETYA